MAVNRYMHPRNIYKIRPDFRQMAIEYPEFRKYVKQDVSGRMTIDFKDCEALRCLSQTLLKKDFDLDIEIPIARLIPTIPLRVNYLLWIEDIMEVFNNQLNNPKVCGIDIGTGASCIYPLIAAKKYEWKMIGTEVDSESLVTAQRNVISNNLQHLISVKKSDGNTLLESIVEPDKIYDFCMCNPPFFSCLDELNPRNKIRSEYRSEPRNAFSGLPTEVVVPGGEVTFVSNIIKESVKLQKQIRLYTTMLGHKTSLKKLSSLLRSSDVEMYQKMEFQQGHTTRWGLAWTFHTDDIAEMIRSPMQKKNMPTLTYVIPQSNDEFKDIVKKVTDLLQALQFKYVKIRRNPTLCVFNANTEENTWSHQRKKRREEMRQKSESVISIKVEVGESSGTSHVGHKRPGADGQRNEKSEKKIKLGKERNSSFLRINVAVCALDSKHHLSLTWVDGTMPKDSLNQVMQYFKNNLK